MQIHVYRWNIFETIFSVILKIEVKILNISSTSNSFSRILWNKYLYNKSSLLFVDLPPFNAVNFKLRMNSAANFTQIAGKLMQFKSFCQTYNCEFSFPLTLVQKVNNHHSNITQYERIYPQDLIMYLIYFPNKLKSLKDDDFKLLRGFADRQTNERTNRHLWL